MDISAVILKKILLEKNLEIFSKLKLSYLDPAYSTLYTVITSHYDKYGAIPSFEELDIVLRDGGVKKTLAMINILEIPDVDIDIVFDALLDQYIQNETIKELEPFIDRIALADAEEIKNSLATIALSIEDKTITSESVVTMSDVLIFQDAESSEKERVYLGINNYFDSTVGGCKREELVMIGGRRGDGKSLTCNNIMTNQYEAGMSSVYFSIEMPAKQVHQRNISILAGVPLANIINNNLSKEDTLKIASVTAGMFQDANKAIEELKVHNNPLKFQEDLIRNYELKKQNQMVIIDDRNLTISAIDLHIGKLKSKFGDNLGLVIVDYINQVLIDGYADEYDWKAQVQVAKKLKNLARKYEVVIVTPYQIDKDGEARYSKAILDSPDIALILSKKDDIINFHSTKMRSAAAIKFASSFNGDTLKISPIPLDLQETKKKKEDSSDEPPWDL